MNSSENLIAVGFWRRFENARSDPEDQRPWPEQGSPRDSHNDVIAFLEAGFVESVEFGYAECRLCGQGGATMGCLSLTDGTYVWPEGLAHYLREHSVNLPPEFEKHATRKLEWLRSTHRFKQGSSEPLLEWTHEGPVAATPETVEWVHKHTRYGKAGCSCFVQPPLCCFKF
jgi:hypothetical protein